MAGGVKGDSDCSKRRRKGEGRFIRMRGRMGVVGWVHGRIMGGREGKRGVKVAESVEGWRRGAVADGRVSCKGQAVCKGQVDPGPRVHVPWAWVKGQSLRRNPYTLEH